MYDDKIIMDFKNKIKEDIIFGNITSLIIIIISELSLYYSLYVYQNIPLNEIYKIVISTFIPSQILKNILYDIDILKLCIKIDKKSIK